MNTLLSHVRISLTVTVLFIVILCVAYPLVVWSIAQTVFPSQANGSLIRRADGTVVGSTLIGQSFSAPTWFHSRPSAAGSGYDPTSSGGSNLGPTSAKLINGTTKTLTSASAAPVVVVDGDGITLRVLHYCDENAIPFTLLREGQVVDQAAFKTTTGWDEVKLITAFNDVHPLTLTASQAIPIDAVTASASGLDPQISVANARLQAVRVAKARGLDIPAVRRMIDQCTQGPDLWILGDPGVNVLRLNLALEHQK